MIVDLESFYEKVRFKCVHFGQKMQKVTHCAAIEKVSFKCVHFGKKIQEVTHCAPNEK